MLDFDENCRFWADLSSKTAKTTFPTQPSTGQHQTLKSMDFSVKQKTNWVHNTNIGVTLLGKTPMNFGQKPWIFFQNLWFLMKTADFGQKTWILLFLCGF